MKKPHTHPIYARAFYGCVHLLETTAAALDPYWPGGMDYVKINVILFCILMPIAFTCSIALNIILLLALA